MGMKEGVEPWLRYYQAILMAFPELGGPPGPGWLRASAEALGLEAEPALNELVSHGLIYRDPVTGAITAAWPFSAVPTPHLVELGDGNALYAMCAIDALGIPIMLGVDATASSQDPVSGKPIRVVFRSGGRVWEPPEAVVFYCKPKGREPSAERGCGYINFFHSIESARAYLDCHPHVEGRILSRSEAMEVAERQFGSLLADSGPSCCSC